MVIVIENAYWTYQYTRMPLGETPQWTPKVGYGSEYDTYDAAEQAAKRAIVYLATTTRRVPMRSARVVYVTQRIEYMDVITDETISTKDTD
jgi:hypothetical protein